jgi:hypothetical protein
VSGVVFNAGGGIIIGGGPRTMSHIKVRIEGTTGAGAHVLRHLRADANGRFALSLPPGHYTVATVPPGNPWFHERHDGRWVKVPSGLYDGRNIVVHNEKPVRVQLVYPDL